MFRAKEWAESIKMKINGDEWWSPKAGIKHQLHKCGMRALTECGPVGLKIKQAQWF